MGGGEWAGFKHDWNHVLKQYHYVCLSASVSLSVSVSPTLNPCWLHLLGRIFHTVTKLTSGGSTLTSRVLATPAERGTSVSYRRMFLQGQGRLLLALLGSCAHPWANGYGLGEWLTWGMYASWCKGRGSIKKGQLAGQSKFIASATHCTEPLLIFQELYIYCSLFPQQSKECNILAYCRWRLNSLNDIPKDGQVVNWGSDFWL